MRSGNGRHRRPRQAPAIFVTAGVTGAGIALPLLGASGAHAADTATWDRVAQCESGGMWSAASGNGFYGGLQLTQDMWDEYGGADYASRPDLASRSQQISVAEAILDDRGPDAWPSCAVNAGLTADGSSPEVDPGGVSLLDPDLLDPSDGSGSSDDDGSAPSEDDKPSEATPSPDASDSAEPSGPSESEPSDSPTADDRGDAPSRSDDPSRADGPDEGGNRTDGTDAPDDASAGGDSAKDRTPGTGRHRGGAEESGEGAGAADDGGRSSGRHASRDGDAHQTSPAGGDYTVRAGDSLSVIAEAREVPGGWPALYDRNEDVVGADADLIKPGQILDLGHIAG